LYGGGHYIPSTTASQTSKEGSISLDKSSSMSFTPQGQAIEKALHKFGDNGTLPFPPCKVGYDPIHKDTGKRRYACRYHNEKRLKRLKKEKFRYRSGEVPLDPFWEFWEEKFKKEKSKKSTLLKNEK